MAGKLASSSQHWAKIHREIKKRGWIERQHGILVISLALGDTSVGDTSSWHHLSCITRLGTISHVEPFLIHQTRAMFRPHLLYLYLDFITTSFLNVAVTFALKKSVFKILARQSGHKLHSLPPWPPCPLQPILLGGLARYYSLLQIIMAIWRASV